MKIISTSVVDPRDAGKASDPYLVVQVDEAVDEISTPIKYGPKFRKISCGPFFAVETWDQKGSHSVPGEWINASDIDLSEFNTMGAHREQLVPVQVQMPDGEFEDLSMGVKHARRLLNKPEGFPWVIVVSEIAALQGRLQWRVEKRGPVCNVKVLKGRSRCRFAPTTVVWYGGAHINLCDDHVITHQTILREKRLASGTK